MLLIVKIVAERANESRLTWEEVRVFVEDLEAHVIEDLDLNIF